MFIAAKQNSPQAKKANKTEEWKDNFFTEHK